MIALGLILMAFCFALFLVEVIMPAFQKWHDDQTYGFPRTIHAKKDVGHGGISDFTGLNLNGYLYIVEIQEGDPTKLNPHIYFLAHVSSDQIPITSITFADENNDGKLDMLVQTENGMIFTSYNDVSTLKDKGTSMNQFMSTEKRLAHMRLIICSVSNCNRFSTLPNGKSLMLCPLHK
jgi:hypothetical protein